MCGEETEAATLFKDVETVGYHKLIVKRTDSADCCLDEIRKLVAEAEGEQCTRKDEKSALPAEFPDEKGYDRRIHRCPDELV